MSPGDSSSRDGWPRRNGFTASNSIPSRIPWAHSRGSVSCCFSKGVRKKRRACSLAAWRSNRNPSGFKPTWARRFERPASSTRPWIICARRSPWIRPTCKPGTAWACCRLICAAIPQPFMPIGEAIRLRPRFVHSHINLANTLLAMGRPAEAADKVRTALQIEPNNPLALLNLVTILIELATQGAGRGRNGGPTGGRSLAAAAAGIDHACPGPSPGGPAR